MLRGYYCVPGDLASQLFTWRLLKLGAILGGDANRFAKYHNRTEQIKKKKEEITYAF